MRTEPTARDQVARSAEYLKSSGVIAELRATDHVFDTRVGSAHKNLIRQRQYHDFDPDNLMEHLPWLVVQCASRLLNDGEAVTAQASYEAAVRQLLDNGPQDVTQMPRKLSKKAAAKIAAGHEPEKVIKAEWRRQVRDLFDHAWGPWRDAIDIRSQIDHPMVRVARVTQHPDSFTLYDTNIGDDIVIVRGRGREVVVSGLVLPAEAEHLLDHPELAGSTALLPSPGVSEERVAAALRMRPAAGKREDPPLRSLAAALTAAAGVLGEPVHGAEYTPANERVTELLEAMLPDAQEAPQPPPRGPKSTGKYRTGTSFAIAA